MPGTERAPTPTVQRGKPTNFDHCNLGRLAERSAPPGWVVEPGAISRERQGILGTKWVHQANPGAIEIGNVAGDDCEIMNQGRRRNLLVERILRVRDT